MIEKLSEINLNLINVLDVLLTEKNTTSAAKKLHITQPTVSYSLKQLREIFDDELLAKNNFSSKMYLTPLAKTLIKPVRETVLKLEEIFKLKDFDPTTSRRQFKIAVTDHTLKLILTKLIKTVNTKAPLVTFYISDIMYSKTKEQLESEDIDIAIGTFQREHQEQFLVYEPLITDETVCWADKNHPAFQKKSLSMEDYIKYPHMIVRHPKPVVALTIENEVYKNIVDNNISNISIHNTTEAASLLQGTDYICLGAKKMADRYASEYNITYKKPPFKVQKFTIYACRHINKNNDQAILWLTSLIKEIAEEIDKEE